jgi:serine/threonine-protein kinase
MEAVIMKSLSKDPRERYFSANAMLDAIERGAPPGTTETPGPARRKVRRGGLVLACGIALLLLLGGGAALASGLIDVPQNGSVAYMKNPVETTDPPPPPQDSSEAARENAGQSGNKNVASVTEAASRQDAQDQRQMVPVPNVRRFYDYWAADTLTNSGFKVDYAPREYRSGYSPRGVTWATDPVAGSMAPEGSTVTIYATPRDMPLPPRLR